MKNKKQKHLNINWSKLKRIQNNRCDINIFRFDSQLNLKNLENFLVVFSFLFFSRDEWAVWSTFHIDYYMKYRYLCVCTKRIEFKLSEFLFYDSIFSFFLYFRLLFVLFFLAQVLSQTTGFYKQIKLLWDFFRIVT